MRRSLVILATVLVSLAVAASAFAVTAERAVLRPVLEGDGLLVVLAVGSDAGPSHRDGDLRTGRGDALHLLAVDPVAKRATVVDIPRDSLIDGRKVNAHLMLGGPERLVAELETFSGVDIDYWVVSSFSGFERMIGELGGIDVVVDQPMHDPYSGSALDPGPQRLDGIQALAFARNRRSLSDGDLGRTRHQGDLLVAAHAEIRRQTDLPTMTRLVGALARNTVSNISPQHLLGLAQLAMDIDPAAVAHEPLGGSTGWQGEASIVNLAPGDTFERIRAGEVGPRS